MGEVTWDQAVIQADADLLWLSGQDWNCVGSVCVCVCMCLNMRVYVHVCTWGGSTLNKEMERGTVA